MIGLALVFIVGIIIIGNTTFNIMARLIEEELGMDDFNIKIGLTNIVGNMNAVTLKIRPSAMGESIFLYSK